MSFFDFFPTPRFLLLSNTGVAVSEKSAQAVENKKKLSLKYCAEAPLPKGAISSGVILDPAACAKVLQELSDTYKFNYVHATLPEEKAYLFTAELEKVPFKDLRDAVAFIIEENVPLSLAESIFYFDVVGGAADPSKIKVAVSVIAEKEVQLYVNMFESAGITPISFDIESQAIARSVIVRGDVRTHLIVNIGETKTGLYVVEDEVVQFSSTPPLGSVEVQGYRDIQSLKSEVRKLFSFWNTRLDKRGIPQRKIERIILCGEGAAKEDFVSELMTGFEVEYSIADVWGNAFSIKEHLPELPFQASLSYPAAIGAALPPRENMYV
jgi:hypothetical protein